MIRSRYRLPSTSSLTAFEAAARHLNFSRAAQELHTSQSAISRHIAGLEQRLNVLLFLRRRKRLALTEQGEHLYRAVVSGLDNIQSAFAMVSAWSPEHELTIACTHEISHLYLLPRFEELQAHMGQDVRIRILTSEYEALEFSPDPRIDLAFAYGKPSDGQGASRSVFQEAVCPVCSPQFAIDHADRLEAGVGAWAGLPLLLLTKQNRGWATWEDWFARVGVPDPSAAYTGIDNYVYLLEACTAGRGIALGWKGLIERHIDSGALQLCWPEFIHMDQGLNAYLTTAGQTKQPAWACLEYLHEQAQSALM
ncbi:MAG: LysR family transcriptional regulator [Pseudomonadota bacterium]